MEGALGCWRHISVWKASMKGIRVSAGATEIGRGLRSLLSCVNSLTKYNSMIAPYEAYTGPFNVNELRAIRIAIWEDAATAPRKHGRHGKSGTVQSELRERKNGQRDGQAHLMGK